MESHKVPEHSRERAGSKTIRLQMMTAQTSNFSLNKYFFLGKRGECYSLLTKYKRGMGAAASQGEPGLSHTKT